MTAKTIGESIRDTLDEMDGPVKAQDLITRVKKEMGASEDTVRSELSRMKRAKEVHQPKYGYYEPALLVESQEVPVNAAVVFRHAETNEVWITIELIPQLTVHKKLELVGGKLEGNGFVDSDGG